MGAVQSSAEMTRLASQRQIQHCIGKAGASPQQGNICCRGGSSLPNMLLSSGSMSHPPPAQNLPPPANLSPDTEPPSCWAVLANAREACVDTIM